MDRVRFLSKIVLAVSVSLALALTFLSCSSDSPTSPSGGDSSSSSSIPPTGPTLNEACNNYWRQAINQIANQCSNATINVPIAPSSDQTYGYDCSLTQADVNAILREVCTFIPLTKDEACNSFLVEAIDQIADQCSSNPINMLPTIINIPIAPSSDQTYGYDCSLTIVDVSAIMKEVCCDRQCFQAYRPATDSSPACRTLFTQCGIVCKKFASSCKNVSP